MKAEMIRTTANLRRFAELLGGEENMREKFPQTYKAYKNTLTGNFIASKTQKNTVANITISSAGYTDPDKKNIFINLETSVLEVGEDKTIASLTDVEIYDTRTGKTVETSSKGTTFQANAQSISHVLPSSVLPFEYIGVRPTLYNLGETIQPYVTDSDLSEFYDAPYSVEFTIEHPRRTNRPTTYDSDIRISFINENAWGSYRDYFYTAQQMGGSNKNNVHLTLHSKGSLVTKDISIDSAVSEIRYKINGNSVRDGYSQTAITSQTGHSITWDYNTPSNIMLSEWVSSITDPIDVVYTLSIIASVRGKNAVFTVTNDKSFCGSTNTKVIDHNIRYYMDCFTEGSVVTMGDRTQKPIEKIAVGDMVLSGENKPVRVEEASISSQLAKLVRITSSEGKSVCVTPGHPVVTAKGLRHAYLIQVNEELYGPDGEKFTAAKVERLDNVETSLFYIALEGNNTRMYVNGFLMGDAIANLTKEEEAVNFRYTIPEKWRVDYDNWQLIPKFTSPVDMVAKGSPRIIDPFISDITQIDIMEEENSYAFNISTKDFCGGDIEVCISTQRSYSAEFRLNVTTSYGGRICGYLTKQQVKPTDYLYLYLYDKVSGVYSNIADVYSAPLKITEWSLTSDREITFSLDRKIAAFDYSQELILAYRDKQPHYQEYAISLPNTKFNMDALGISEKTPVFDCGLRLCMEKDGVKVWGATSEAIKVYISHPKVTGISLSWNSVTAHGSFAENLGADLYAGEIFVRALEPINRNTFNIEPDKLGDDGDYSVCFYYKTHLGTSYRSEKLPLVTRVPEITGCTFRGREAVVDLRKEGAYMLTSQLHTPRKFMGSRFTLPAGAKEVYLCAVKGVSEGQKIEVKPARRGYYPIEIEGEIYYVQMEAPYIGDTVGENILSSSIVVDLPLESVPYKGKFFILSGKELMITSSIYKSDSAHVRKDYADMLKANSENPEVVKTLHREVVRNMPMKADDMLYYHYGCHFAEGYTGIVQGMRLEAEYAIFDKGFVSTGFSHYQAISRGGRITFNSFASMAKLGVAPPAPIKQDNKMDGGAGLADLLYSGFEATFVLLVYPSQFISRTGEDSKVYNENICLLTSEDWGLLQTAAANMRKRGLSIEGVNYNYFRGRCVITPQILISVNKSPLWVTLGSSLGDITDMFGMGDSINPLLERNSPDGLITVFGGDTDMPLLMGDCISF